MKRSPTHVAIRSIVPGLAALILARGTLFAFYLPSFGLDTCSWTATHIVVVDEGETLDGVVEILESWTGELEAGEKLTIPDLERFASDEPRRLHDAQGEPTQRILDSRRIVLFLMKKDDTWQPAQSGFGGIGISSAWVDGGRAHVRSQMRISGPQVLHATVTEAEMRDRALRVANTRTELADTLAERDVDQRLERLVRLAHSDIRHACQEAIAAIGSLEREIAAKTVRGLLEDDTLSSTAKYWAMQTLQRLADGGATADFVALLERELAFWRTREAESPGTPASSDRALEDRVDTSQYALEALRGADPSVAEIIDEFREFVRDSKALRSHRSILERCATAALESLRSPKAASPTNSAPGDTPEK